jgi:D-psicose/D-tagatose/L-ribulose 3-epimerase
VPWDEVAQACRDIGFNGPFVIESFTNKVKSIAKAAAIWRKFADSQDALATNGLRHLRTLFPQ